MGTKPECLECQELPTGCRPVPPRKIDARSGPRTPRCHTHIEARLKNRTQAKHEDDRERNHGMTPAQHAKLLAAQGGLCPCGARVKHVDHDHRLAKTHDHPTEQGCKACWRGLLCHNCNSYVLGRGYDQRRLLALVAYLNHPPALELLKREAS